MPQRLNHDVDLDTLPLLAYNAKVVKNSKSGKGFMIQNQVRADCDMGINPQYFITHFLSQGLVVPADRHTAGHINMADLHSSEIRIEAQVLLTNGLNDGPLCACLSNRFLAMVNLYLGHVRLFVRKFRTIAQLLTGDNRTYTLGGIFSNSHCRC